MKTHNQSILKIDGCGNARHHDLVRDIIIESKRSPPTTSVISAVRSHSLAFFDRQIASSSRNWAESPEGSYSGDQIALSWLIGPRISTKAHILKVASAHSASWVDLPGRGKKVNQRRRPTARAGRLGPPSKERQVNLLFQQAISGSGAVPLKAQHSSPPLFEAYIIAQPE